MPLPISPPISVAVAGDEVPAFPANDNGEGPPAVRVPEGRPDEAYAHQGNLILPLQFARLMPGWRAGSGAGSPPPWQTPASRRTLGSPGRRVRISDRRC
jgi:hypothetical protein